MAEACIFQFKMFDSFVAPSFWHKLAEKKIDVDRLNDDRKSINGFYTNSDAMHCLLETDATSFNRDFDGRSCIFQCHGALFNKNRIEDFKSCDKLALIREEGNLIWNDIASGAFLQQPSLLSRFLILSFGDLKAFNYYYWFAYPCPNEPLYTKMGESTPLNQIFGESILKTMNDAYFSLPSEQRAFFIIRTNSNDGTLTVSQLSAAMCVEKRDSNFADADLENIYFCFSDPCADSKYGGWPLRLYLLALCHLCPRLRGKPIKVLSLRVKKLISLEHSLQFIVRLPETDVNSETVKWIGWEPNNKGKFLPKCVSLALSMDPQKLAETGVYLNLKLMKWRLLPELDLKAHTNLKCLLFGAGTLGCSVARNLIAWGVQHITFIDSGTVSFSNPVRQSLYTHDDAAKKVEKAMAAAFRLKEIHPGITTNGFVLQIPMPGHPIGDSIKEKTIENLSKIESLLREHDAIFLLTDSRESRWLPTMLAAANNKIVINAALGFDSYLVMRHGCNPLSVPSVGSFDGRIEGLKCIAGNNLGCYFCNDITSPGDSMKDRTLDQQCTVTRPAVSSIAGALAVELLISLIQHPAKAMCPAYISVNNTNLDSAIDKMPEGLLGIIPHSIRGSIGNFEQILPATERFSQCVACSKNIVDTYRVNGHEFLFDVFESPKTLEDLSGISDMLNIQYEEILEFEEAADFDLSD